jgi:hypothetical protein
LKSPLRRPLRPFSTSPILPAPSTLLEPVSDPPVPSRTPWLDRSRIAVSTSRDFLAAIENGRDDRTLAVKRAQAVQALTSRSRPTFKFGTQAKQKVAPKPKRKVERERTDETREYFREYQRRLRARKKAEMADASTNLHDAPS